MSSPDLPALVLPNTANSMDATVLLASGIEISATQFTQRLGSPAHLRFMASPSDGWSPDNPRVTWTTLPSGDLVAALAFPLDHDAHGRVTSAAVVIDPRQDAPLPERLPTAVRQALQDFLARQRQAIVLRAETLDPLTLAPLASKKKAQR